jgi:hypothetical protein
MLAGGEDYRRRWKMTAAEAIRNECRACQPEQRMTPEKCETTMCKLSPNAFECRSSVKRIRTHCLDCAALDFLPGTNVLESPQSAVKKCEGRLLRENGNAVRWTDADGVERGVCFLNPYRFGKNPHRPKKRSHPGDFKPSKTRARGQNPTLESTISPETDSGTGAPSRDR